MEDNHVSYSLVGPACYCSEMYITFCSYNFGIKHIFGSETLRFNVSVNLTIPGLIDQHETESAGLEPERCNWTRELCLLILKWLIPPIPISDPKYCNTFIAKIDHHIFTRRSVLARLRLPNREIVITEVSWRPPGKWFKYKRVMGVNDGSQVCSCY
jgi:hypothetical protein